MKIIHIEITATIPDDNHELGHEAIVAAREPVEHVLGTLKAMGLDPKQSRKLVVKRDPKAAAGGSA